MKVQKKPEFEVGYILVGDQTRQVIVYHRGPKGTIIGVRTKRGTIRLSWANVPIHKTAAVAVAASKGVTGYIVTRGRRPRLLHAKTVNGALYYTENGQRERYAWAGDFYETLSQAKRVILLRYRQEVREHQAEGRALEKAIHDIQKFGLVQS